MRFAGWFFTLLFGLTSAGMFMEHQFGLGLIVACATFLAAPPAWSLCNHMRYIKGKSSFSPKIYIGVAISIYAISAGLLSSLDASSLVAVKKPDQYDLKPSLVKITENNIQMKGDNRDFLTVGIRGVIDSSKTDTANRAATAIDLAYKAYEEHQDASAIFVYLQDPQSNRMGTVARVSLYPKKCGMLENNCDGIQWDLYTANNTPSQLERKAFQLWWQYRDSYQINDMTDEDGLKAFIAKKLDVPLAQITYFSYNDYNNHETF